MPPTFAIPSALPGVLKPQHRGAHAVHRLLRNRFTYVLMGAVILALDAVVRPVMAFPILFVIPVSMSAWYCRRAGAMLLAVVLPLGRMLPPHFHDLWESLSNNVPNTLIRMFVLCWIAYFVRRSSVQAEALQREVRVLTGILPTCLGCRRIQDDKKQWHQMEAYIAERSEAEFSHGYCPECEAKAMAAMKAELGKG